MTSAASASTAPNLMFSHMGFAVSDMARMEDFYIRVLGLTLTDTDWRKRFAARMNRYTPANRPVRSS